MAVDSAEKKTMLRIAENLRKAAEDVHQNARSAPQSNAENLHRIADTINREAADIETAANLSR